MPELVLTMSSLFYLTNEQITNDIARFALVPVYTSRNRRFIEFHHSVFVLFAGGLHLYRMISLMCSNAGP